MTAKGNHRGCTMQTDRKAGETCNIFGVNVAVTNMEQVVLATCDNIDNLRGQYYCVCNVHTLVMAADEKRYRKVQNCAALVLPDGAPLSKLSRLWGYSQASRVTGPDLMEQLFKQSEKDKTLRHFFYGATQETLDTLQAVLTEKYPNMVIAGMYSPPFRQLTREEDAKVIDMINQSGANLIWVGLGAPKQEIWMYQHRNKLQGLMIGVGAGFNYHAGLLERAPQWMQRHSLEWLFRLLQEPGRLWKRYLQTNVRFAIYALKETVQRKK